MTNASVPTARTETPAPTNRYRKPAASPTADDLRQRDEWNAYVSASLATAQKSAEKWRTGLAGFVSLITTALLIAGPGSAADMPTPWRLAVTVLMAAGLASAIGGLWKVLRAAAGDIKKTSLEQIVTSYGSIGAMQVALAGQATRLLKQARSWMAASLLVLGAGIFAWWWSPQGAPLPAAYLKVTTASATYCGELSSGDRNTIVLKVKGEQQPRTVSYSAVQNIEVVAEC